MRRLFQIAVLSFPWVLGALVAAQEPAPADNPTAPMSVEAALARVAQRPPDPQEALAKARQRLTAALTQLDQLLAKSTPKQRQQWQTFLGVATIRGELARPQIDAAALRAIQRRYFENHSGLELPAMVELRRSASDLLTAAEYAQADAPGEVYRHKLDQLKKLLTQLDAHSSDEAAQQAGAIVAWLDPLSEDGAALAKAVRAR